PKSAVEPRTSMLSGTMWRSTSPPRLTKTKPSTPASSAGWRRASASKGGARASARRLITSKSKVSFPRVARRSDRERVAAKPIRAEVFERAALDELPTPFPFTFVDQALEGWRAEFSARREPRFMGRAREFVPGANLLANVASRHPAVEVWR